MDTAGSRNQTLRSSLLCHAHRVLLLLVAVAPMLTPSRASATHFRYGHINWSHVNYPAQTKTIQFTVQAAWRQDAVTTGGYRCVDPASFTNQATPLTTIPCTGPLISGQRNPGVGDVFVEGLGDVFLEFGDSSNNTIGGPGGDPLLFKVTSEDPANNWVFALALDTNSLPSVDTTIQHTYASTGNKTARLNDCCRISPCTTPNAHMNNPDNNYIVQTTVSVGSGDSSPVSSLLPIVRCPINGLCTFTVPASDNEVDSVSFRMSTNAESGLTSQPGSPQCPSGHAASISSAGVYTWDTTGCRTAGGGGTPPSGSCSSASLNTLYSTQVMIEEPVKGTKTAVDFFIQLVPTCALPNQPPAFDQVNPLCGSTLSAGPGSPISFTVHSTDSNAGDSITLGAAGIPSGASLTPALPNAPANPAATTLNWTPGAGDIGQHVITFSASDACSQSLCSITIDVSQENCTDGIDNDFDSLADCADPDCNGTACNDGNACTLNDTCHSQTGTCGGSAVTCTATDQCHDAGSCSPGTGLCSNPAKTDGATCSDGNACTQGDSCQSGTCAGGNPVICTASDTCHAVGTCDTGTGVCSNPVKPDGASCSDGDACTQTDTCQGGTCSGSNPVTCAASDQCHQAGTCDTGTGVCSNPARENGTVCNDGNACTQSDSCQSGTCTGSNPVICPAADQCHAAGTCDTNTGICSNPAHANGTACNDGNGCTQSDSCQSGTCSGNPVVCTAADQCHDIGTCDTETGTCSNPPRADGSSCSDGLACTQNDSCQAGTCSSGPRLDCSSLTDACHDGTCSEPAGTCASVQKVDGFGCEDGNACTVNDRCSGGVCMSGADSGDTDGDGYCDGREIQAQCDFADPLEIPPQGNIFSGGRVGRGEILLTWASPGVRIVRPPTDFSCAMLGACDPTTHFCDAGKVADPCSADSDCNQPSGMCRLVVNYAATSDLNLVEAKMRIGRLQLDLLPQFRPVTPGCSRKVDLALPTDFKRGTLRLKASGTTNGRVFKDRDRIYYRK